MAGRLAKPRLHVRARWGRPSLSSLAGGQGGIAHTHTYYVIITSGRLASLDCTSGRGGANLAIYIKLRQY